MVGAGLAGCEAALAAARADLDVLLVTTSLDTVYMLAHGRARLVAPEGTLLEELSGESAAAGGELERWELHRAAKYALEAQGGIHLLQSNVTGLIVEGGRVTGVRTWEGVERRSRLTALCVGSFLGARLRQGRLREVAGRLGEMAYDEIFHDLQGLGLEFSLERLDLDESDQGPPYSVSYQALARGERGVDGFAVSRLDNLYAAGVCAGGAPGYSQAAAQGSELGRLLAGLARHGADGGGTPREGTKGEGTREG